MSGIRTDGIRTIDDLKARCVVDDLTGCWHYQGRAGVHPTVWLPALSKKATMGTVICVLKTGERPKNGQVWHCTCRTIGCANPQHRKAGTRSSQMLAAKMQRNPLQRARLAAAAQRRSRISDEQVRQIIAADGPLSAIAAEHGISIAHAHNIRTGKLRRALAAPGASIFSWRPAA